MSRCDVCGNEYERAFEVTTFDGGHFTFDSIECAVHKVAPECQHCGCRVLGHGIEAEGAVYCCANCARESGVRGVSDNVTHPA